MLNTYKIAVVPGDGIGREITPVALSVARAAMEPSGAALEATEFPFGAGHYLEHGAFMPPDGLETLRPFDAILFGAVGLPRQRGRYRRPDPPRQHLARPALNRPRLPANPLNAVIERRSIQLGYPLPWWAPASARRVTSARRVVYHCGAGQALKLRAGQPLLCFSRLIVKDQSLSGRA
jgi:hypothetical protein